MRAERASHTARAARQCYQRHSRVRVKAISAIFEGRDWAVCVEGRWACYEVHCGTACIDAAA